MQRYFYFQIYYLIQMTEVFTNIKSLNLNQWSNLKETPETVVMQSTKRLTDCRPESDLCTACTEIACNVFSPTRHKDCTDSHVWFFSTHVPQMHSRKETECRFIRLQYILRTRTATCCDPCVLRPGHLETPECVVNTKRVQTVPSWWTCICLCGHCCL